MRTSKRSLISQRKLIEKKIRPWIALRTDPMPRSGWIRAVRGALGMSTRQLADLVGVEQSSISRLEEREPLGKITLERLAATANAMHCKLIYAIVPDDRHSDLESIINTRARDVAQQLIQRAEHSMRLEKQGTHDEDPGAELQRLTNELKSKLDPRIWGKRRTSAIGTPK